MDGLIEELLDSIRSQSLNSPGLILEIEREIANQKYRQAFLLIQNLKEKNLWTPNASEEKLLEAFWWEFAN